MEMEMDGMGRGGVALHCIGRVGIALFGYEEDIPPVFSWERAGERETPMKECREDGKQR